ncbi:MAG: hypothetical protein KDD60_11330, partial [Bdellovibrionales bacterium]|nr:hypothetical protein [Bdellovibrionales bacterium]
MENAKSRKGGLLKKYQLYEASVQDPEQQIRVFHHVYSENFGRLPKLLKEDFSGTFWISSEWVKRGTDRQAYALDIEDAVLKAGKALHYGALS